MSKLIAFNKSSSALCGPVGVVSDSPIIIIALEVSTTLIGLILPGLLAYFIYKKKEVFGFESNENNLDA